MSTEQHFLRRSYSFSCHSVEMADRKRAHMAVTARFVIVFLIRSHFSHLEMFFCCDPGWDTSGLQPSFATLVEGR